MRNTTIQACVRWSVTWLLVVGSALAQATQATQVAALDRMEVPTAGRQQLLLTVSQFGRYAIRVTSEEGTALQLIDRMAGPGPVSGKPGEENGRLDVFLDRGEYRVLTQGDLRATGKARVSVEPFTEKNDPRPPLLIELKQIETTLADLEQRSYWIEVKERRRVFVEAAGRSLGDLRLWKEGKWLVDATPATQVVQPKSGRPLFTCRLWPDLEPGLYLLTAYGRPPQPWADETRESPLYLRAGIPRLGQALRKRLSVSPFGIDTFLVPGRANYFRLELPMAAVARLKVASFSPQSPFEGNAAEAEISKKSVPPVAEIITTSQDADRIITVNAEAGQSCVLQHFERLDSFSFQGRGAYWLSTLLPGDPADSIDATGIVVANWPDGSTLLLGGQGVELDLKTAWRRRFNLLQNERLFLEVKEAGDYVVAGQGASAQFRIEPFLINLPPNYRAPAFQPSGFNWKLGPGWYVLTILAGQKGILDLTIRPNNWVNYALNAAGMGGEPGFRSARATVRFAQLSLQSNLNYTLITNSPGTCGTVLRRLPMDLADPLALASGPGEEVEVPFRAGETGMLRAEAEDGSKPELSLDGGAWQATVTVAPGPHTVKVRHQAKQTVYFSLSLQSPLLESSTPLPEISPELLSKMPAFPVLSEAKAQFLDLGRLSQATFLLKADKPGLYQVESTGLLATKAVLRSRTAPAFATESQNGTGRNFSLRQYLTQGDYQLTVGTEGASAGHLGVQLQRTRAISGGFLTSTVPARISLPPGEAVAYYFKITSPGEFHVRAFGLGRTFRCRLEDNGGWPVVPPGGAADITQFFDPGTYRLIILPEMTEARVVTQLDPVLRPRVYRGHGPHRLSLARTVEALWLEPEAGQARTPDVWEFALPAPSHVVVQLTGEMQGTLTRPEAGSQAVFVPPERGWQGRLEAGDYRLEVVSSRVNNRAPYRLAVSPMQLMTGMSRTVSAPARIPVSVGSEGAIELSSFGGLDVRGRLYDAEGRLVAGNDDRPDDWNFQIIQTLGPGEYSLRVDPVGIERADCIVSMRTPEHEEQSAVTLPFKQEATLSRKTLILPILPPREPGLLAVRTTARDSLGLSLEADFGQGWRVLGTRYGLQADLLVPLAARPEARYRLTVWSLDRRPTVAQLSVLIAAVPAVAEAQLAEGLQLSPIPDSTLSVASVRMDRAGVFEIEPGSSTLLWSGDDLSACASPENHLVAARSGLVWIAARTRKGDSLPTARGRRLVLQAGTARYLQYRHGDALSCDVAAGARGPLLLRVTGTTGQPGVSLGAGGAWTVSDHSAVGARLKGEGSVAELWSASPTDDMLVVKAQPFAFAEPLVEAGPADGDGEVEAQVARRFALKSGWKRVALSLGPGLVALLTKGDTIESVHWKAGQSLFETVDTEADQIYLLNTESHPNRFGFDVLPLAGDQAFPALAMGRPYEADHVRSGVDRLKVTALPHRAVIRVRGGEGDAVLVLKSGRVSRGTDLSFDGQGGELQVPHGTGPVICWIDQDGSDQAIWPDVLRVAPALIEPPAVVTLPGQVSRAFRFERSLPGLVHFRAAGPLLTTVRRPSSAPDTAIYPRGADVAIYLPEGNTELLVRGLAGHPLAGQAEIGLTSVGKLEEGLGPDLLLPPGSGRLYSFEVVREGEIGIGVRAESEVIELALMSTDGKTIARGSLIMPHLTPGVYLLEMKVSSTAPGPVKARPVVVGLKLPDTGPPQEVIQEYLRPPGEARSFSSRSSESQASRLAEQSEEEPVEENEPAEEPTEPTEPPR